jgi:hypothetical protein
MSQLTTGAPAPKNPIDVITDFFGELPEDVITPIDVATAALQQLNALFAVIARLALDVGATEIHALAELGGHYAELIGDYTHDRFAAFAAALMESGVKS